MSRRFKILVVDDEPINIQVITAALKEKYDVIASTNGFDAITRLKAVMPDLILLDVMMPDMDGFDVCRNIKADDSFADIPVIFLTALDTYEGALRGLELGGIDYLAKPVDLDMLKLRVRNHLELKKRNELIKEQRDMLAIQNVELEAALVRIKRLEGIIPICMHCKSIRTDTNSWQRLEEYLMEHTDALFSHGICSECMGKYYPEMTEQVAAEHE